MPRGSILPGEGMARGRAPRLDAGPTLPKGHGPGSGCLWPAVLSLPGLCAYMYAYMHIVAP
eukprot:4643382-Lingulodinium_polyedra.AAC.1